MSLEHDPAQLNQYELLKQLLSENRQFAAELERLRAENAELRAEIERLKNQPPRSAAPFSKNTRKPSPKRPGRKPRQGPFRHRSAPAQTDYSAPPIEVPVNLIVCPDCGGPLQAVGNELVTNTELPPTPKPRVNAYRIQIQSCSRCQRQVRGQHAEVAADQWGATAHRLGPRAQAVAQLLHYEDGLPQRKVPRVLERLTGLRVTQGALAQAAQRLGTGSGVVARQYQQLRTQIKEQERINTDDTGWRVNGETAYLMAFDSPDCVVYQIRARHRNEEVREVIGAAYGGILGTDRGKSYDARALAEVRQQKCLGHILRNLAEVLADKTGRACDFSGTLKMLLQEALELYRAFHNPAQPLRDYAQQVRALELALSYHLRPRALSDADNQRLLDELGWHHARGNLLRFLHEPTVIEPTNNVAERALRPAVIARKVSQCSKNEQGAAAFAAFKSVIGTLKKSGGDLLEKLTSLITPTAAAEPVTVNTS
jgi:transposase